jgi:diacylglycerol O-acyltransferase
MERTAMSTPAASRMSRVDTAWLRMDNDVNLMMIVGVWLLEPAITLRGAARARRRQAAEVRALPPEGRVRHATGANWVDDDDFDIARHVVAQRCRGAGARASARRCRRCAASSR